MSGLFVVGSNFGGLGRQGHPDGSSASNIFWVNSLKR